MTTSDESAYETERGFFGYLELIDLYGSQVRVQQSSRAFHPAVWVFIEGRKDGPPGSRLDDGNGHLSLPQARRVRDALSAFIADADKSIEMGYYDPEPEDG